MTDEVIWLSWTMAKRWEDCPTLAWAHRTKQVGRATDEKPFFVGRVVHTAAERWLALRGTTPMAELIGPAWVTEEDVVAGAGTVTWGHGERQASYERAHAVALVLEQQYQGLRLAEVAHLLIEQRFRRRLEPHEDRAGMYAQPDIVATVGDVGYLIEQKSGKSYDPAQAHWYVAVVATDPAFAHVRRWFAVPLRPAVRPETELVPITVEHTQAQLARVRRIVGAMHTTEPTPSPGWYCSRCEARAICPSWSATYGHVTRGRVGLGRR